MAATLEIARKPYTTATTEAPTPLRPKTPSWVERCFVKFKAKRRAGKIMRSLNEAKQIHAGKRKAKSFDDFLKEF